MEYKEYWKFAKEVHQGEHKESKVAKVCASIRWDLECEKYSKSFCK